MSQSSSIYLVLDPDGAGLFRVVTDLERANQTARNIGGVVCRMPVLVDYRNSSVTPR